MNTVPCKGCGKPILWTAGPHGSIPLDPRAPVYAVQADGKEIPPRVVRANETGALVYYYVSHFATCSAANDFSASKRKAK